MNSPPQVTSTSRGGPARWNSVGQRQHLLLDQLPADHPPAGDRAGRVGDPDLGAGLDLAQRGQGAQPLLGVVDVPGEHRRPLGRARGRAEPVPADPVDVLGQRHRAGRVDPDRVERGVDAGELQPDRRHDRGDRGGSGRPGGHRGCGGGRGRCGRGGRAEHGRHRRPRRRVRPGHRPGRRQADGEGGAQREQDGGSAHGGAVRPGWRAAGARRARRRPGRRRTARSAASAARRRPDRRSHRGHRTGAELMPVRVCTASWYPASDEPQA